MAIYFTSKSRLITKAVNIHPIAKKWIPMRRTTASSSTTTTTVHATSTGNVPAKSGGSVVVGHPQRQFHSSNNKNAGEGGGGGAGSDKGRSGKSRKFLKLHKALPRQWQWSAGAGWTILSVLDWWLLVAGGWLSWQGVILRWTPLGVCLAAAIQWHLHNRELDRKGLPRTATKWQTNVYCSLPLRLVSRGWGWMAKRRIPIPFRPTVYGVYSTAFGVNLNEAMDPDFKNYRSISEFFTRSLKPECRVIDTSAIVSPADGTVLYFGLANEAAHIEQVKGVSYSLEAFMGSVPGGKAAAEQQLATSDCNNNDMQQREQQQQQQWPTEGETERCKSYLKALERNRRSDSKTALYQCVIYLAPGDYHRFHSPANWQPEVRRHFVGELLSVSPRVAQWLPGLFCLNERVLYMGEWEHGFFSFTAVGATNVGSVQIFMDEGLKTNRWVGLQVGRHKHVYYEERVLPEDTSLDKGQLLGQFNMGSTVVLIFEAPKDFQFAIEPGQKILMGQKLGDMS